ncbi:F-box/kelch-repeat protein At1g57790-like [Papaver somniferum]|uniref:F-box/kelch-repeat protein At1g57790-like n=1 Tax=Papaver somniferum TaxID=3469 RepID=UPI000E6FAEBC|nr:F-box/kelch-repeat protein At1g57790-like [Papaver somniferum]
MEWKEVNSLGDHVLFIGTKGTAVCSAAEVGFAKGCLYFTLEENQSLCKFEVESTSNSAILPCLNLPAPWGLADWIMIPNGRKREDDMEGKDEAEKNVIKAVEREAHVFSNDEGGKHVGVDNEGDLEKPRPWYTLIEDMVESIADCLHRLDYAHFRSVCKANLALMPMRKLTSTCATRGTYPSPWLMFSRDHGCAIFDFVNPMHNNEKYFLNLSDLVGSVIRFQKGGWLLMSKEDQETSSLFFYNPFTRETIKLPQLPFDEIYGCSGISFSSLPTSSDCAVFAIERKGIEKISFYFIRKGEAFWSSFVFGNADTEKYIPLHNAPVICNGVFYCVDYNGALGVFNIEDNSWKVLEKPHQQFGAMYPSFLVECGGELVLVKLERYGTLFGIFRLDFDKMQWIRVESLRKHMLFVSYTSCISAIAPTSRMENRMSGSPSEFVFNSGCEVKFWEDAWLCNVALRLYAVD